MDQQKSETVGTARTLSNGEFNFQDFSNQDLSKQNLSHSKFIQCNFNGTNLEKADCTYSLFTGADFTDANLRYTNFAYSNLTNIKFFPRDAYGVVFSMECKTFQGMKISRLWWLSFIYFGLMQEPEKEHGVDPRDGIIVAIGGERFKKLARLFSCRGM